MYSHWQRQGDEPLFPDLLWSRPENKLHAGKLLIIGGTAQSFAAPAEAYAAAEKAGAGSVRVLLPDSLRRTVGKLFPTAEFAPSTPSGSFGMMGLAELIAVSNWADGVMISDDTGNNSETAQLFESYYDKYSGQLTLSGSSVSPLTSETAVEILNRPSTTIILSFSELQKLATSVRFTTAFTSDMGLARLVETLHDLNKHHAAHFVVLYENNAVVAVDGHVSTTPVRGQSPTQLAAQAATWWLQNPTKPFEAITTSLVA